MKNYEFIILMIKCFNYFTLATPQYLKLLWLSNVCIIYFLIDFFRQSTNLAIKHKTQFQTSHNMTLYNVQV